MTDDESKGALVPGTPAQPAPVPAGESRWEIVAEGPPQPIPPPPPPGTPGRWKPRWVFLLVIIALFAGFWYGRMSLAPRAISEVEAPRSYTGIKPPEQESALSRETRQLVERLEALARENRWGEIRVATETASPALQEHPFVRAFRDVAVVRTRTAADKARLPTVERELASLERRLKEDGAQAGLLDLLRLARADLILQRSRSEELLTRNTDELRRLVSRQPFTPAVIDLRLRLSQLYEFHGDRAFKEASGIISAEPLRMTAARSYFQMALRWVIAEDQWALLQPISAEARVASDRLLQKIRQANASIHGRALPFTQKDPETWTGKKGDPVHDAPGAAW